MLNPKTLFKINQAKEVFVENHPKFPLFLKAVQSSIKEGTIIEINVTEEDGKQYSTNVKLKDSDIELFQELSKLSK